MSTPVILEGLQAAFPGWLHVAQFSRPFMGNTQRTGLYQTLDADDVPQLAQQLRTQEAADQALSSRLRATHPPSEAMVDD
ncbi:hypothetical protein ACIBKY_07455 [Nonomuraea sp. NPDC050394]|uniref:hypothetical protein n=1 Tax=Nonomuraea sp. NPDC050394 TaxID=3364363 RepID=UPI0037B4628B